jgi:hypothetical protein
MSARRCTDSTTSTGGRLAVPKGSTACQPTVHRPNVNLSSGVGWVLLIDVLRAGQDYVLQ